MRQSQIVRHPGGWTHGGDRRPRRGAVLSAFAPAGEAPAERVGAENCVRGLSRPSLPMGAPRAIDFPRSCVRFVFHARANTSSRRIWQVCSAHAAAFDRRRGREATSTRVRVTRGLRKFGRRGFAGESCRSSEGVTRESGGRRRVDKVRSTPSRRWSRAADATRRTAVASEEQNISATENFSSHREGLEATGSGFAWKSQTRRL